MLTIIGSILGLFGSLLPEILKFFNLKEDHKHEIEMAKLQMEAQEKLHQEKLEEINVTADVAESEALYKAAEQKITGWKVVDGLVSLYSSSVRPSLTYGFFIFYVLVKYAQYNVFVASNYTNWQIVYSLWSSEDMAIFSTIISFWYGSRFLKYALGRAPSVSSAITSALKTGIKK